MQMINTGINGADSAKLTEFVALLNEVAVPEYFSKIELEDNLTDSSGGYALVKFYVDNALFLELRENKNNIAGTVRIILPNTEYAITGNVNWLGTGLLVTDRAIAFFYGTIGAGTIGYRCPFIVCKTTDDKTMCMYYGSSSFIAERPQNLTVSSSSYGIVQHVAGENAVQGDQYFIPSGSTTNSDGVTVAAALPAMTGHIAKDVYQALNRSPYTIEYPFLFTQNGESYCGVAFCNYIIKTT